MQITTKEISLEELNNNVVEYVLKSPHNTNPAILRQMLNSRGSSAPAKSTIIFTISGDTDLGDEISDEFQFYLANVVTGETVTPEELAKITLSGTGFIATGNGDDGGLEINGTKYTLGQILGFGFNHSGNSSLVITAISPEGDGLCSISITNSDYTQRYLDALMQEITDA